ncbi:hypothetical protein SAMN05216349_1437 [Oribacterium sp. KHPX15]|uniref:hypothetical protein n=1 Tax=Oribacterium sp. KHPX15 TaxID=1855342 RepID=UPI000899E518|nr:hypothetical protein [Oribacterium sp. KHPX15]SEA88069.1 hypothetical protein SAMN05216349_1437 [Oribacterium sp. KHPX15]
MKRLAVIIISAAMALSVCACGGGAKPAETKVQETTASTVDTTAPVEPKKEGHWKTELSRDEFGDITEESIPVISGYFEGDFSNSATASSELTVNVLTDGNILGFYLYEYGKTKASFLSSEEKVIKIKIAGDITEDKLEETGGGGLACNGFIGNLITKSLEAGNDVRCIIEAGYSKYNFTMVGDNYDDAVSEKEEIIDKWFSEAVSLLEQGECEKALKKFNVVKDFRNVSQYTKKIMLYPKRIKYDDGRARSYEYDSDFNVISCTIYRDNGTSFTHKYEYSDGLLKSITGDLWDEFSIVFSEDGTSADAHCLMGGKNPLSLTGHKDYAYDENGMIKEISYDNGEIIEYTYDYDDNGFITKVSAKGKRPEEFHYDEYGLLVSGREVVDATLGDGNWKVVDAIYLYPASQNYNNFIRVLTEDYVVPFKKQNPD